MIKCYECKAVISESAETCPRCGAVQLKGDPLLPDDVRRIQLVKDLANIDRFADAFQVSKGVKRPDEDVKAVRAYAALYGHDDGEQGIMRREAAERLVDCANEGSALAAYFLSRHCANEKRPESHDEHSSRLWTEKAAERGNTKCLNHRAYLLMNMGARAAAFQHYRRSAELGDQWGCWQTALCYLFGRGVPASLENARAFGCRLLPGFCYRAIWKAIYCLMAWDCTMPRFESFCLLERIVTNREVAPEDCPEAYHVLGRDLIMTTRNAQKGINVLSLAERVGMAESFVEHAHYLLQSVRHPRRDADKLKLAQRRAFRLYGKAADLGCAEGLFRLGMAYAKGEGVRKSLDKAQSLIRSAAEGGYDEAVSELLVPTVG